MKEIFLGILLLMMSGKAFAQEISVSKYLLTNERYSAYPGLSLQLSGRCIEFYDYGYSCQKIATIEASVPNYTSGLLSFDPFVSAIRKAGAELGANAIEMGETSTVDKDTKAYFKTYATAYRIIDADGNLYLPMSNEQEYVTKLSLQFAKRTADRKKLQKDLEGMSYSKLRNQALADSLVSFYVNLFSVSDSTATISEKTQVSDLSPLQLLKLEKFTQRIPANTVGETLVKNMDAYIAGISKTRLPLLKELRGKYPKDYAEFRAGYKSLYGADPEEQASPKATSNQIIKK